MLPDLAPRIFGFLAGSGGLLDGRYWLVPPVLIHCMACVVPTFLYDAWLNSERVPGEHRVGEASLKRPWQTPGQDRTGVRNGSAELPCDARPSPPDGHFSGLKAVRARTASVSLSVDPGPLACFHTGDRNDFRLGLDGAFQNRIITM